ncbi:hypothetical protein HAX54_023036 [Datura stramonium]|uniref:EF-hand domain-containing protein n=1 Tax=Datura stramonium TaxID=4076 RepID=A0ABS8UXL4_DATST|nr:hypothetical protein [Datura stramonium]
MASCNSNIHQEGIEKRLEPTPLEKHVMFFDIDKNGIIYPWETYQAERLDPFVEEKFEEIFKKHARSNGNALTGQEVDEMLKANREPKDYKGR